MRKNNLSGETEKKLLQFFNDTVDSQNLVKAIRQLNCVIALSQVTEDDAKYAQKENLIKGVNWLNELAEIINPYVEYQND